MLLRRQYLKIECRVCVTKDVGHFKTLIVWPQALYESGTRLNNVKIPTATDKKFLLCSVDRLWVYSDKDLNSNRPWAIINRK